MFKLFKRWGADLYRLVLSWTNEKQLKNMLQNRITIVLSISVVALLLVAFALFQKNTVTVTVSIGDSAETVVTEAETVGEVLKELNITYTHHDIIEPELDTPITNRMDISYVPAKNVSLIYYGTLKNIWTTEDTVKGALRAQSLQLRDEDQVLPSSEMQIEDQMVIEIALMSEQEEQETMTIGYETIEQENHSMLRGQKKVIQEGIEGIIEHTYLVHYKNGHEIDRILLEAETIQEKQDKIVEVGTIDSIIRDGYVFAPQRVLENVTVTAYGAGPMHTGKTQDHPHYGLTRSGSRATEGRTIAVDPNVIPLGTWVYIEGIGLRRAEDTGGAVKGNKIDVFYDDDGYAKAFGLKRGYKVYIIGKQKPQRTE